MPYFLTRQPSTDDGTLGELTDNDGKRICYTIELPWLDNHPQTSCIPIGVYTAQVYESPRHGQVWKIMNVPNRSNIEIHGANTVADLLGCIGVGSEIGTLNNLPAVLNSQATLDMLRELWPDEFILTIGEANGTST